MNTLDRLTFHVPGPPVGKGRPRLGPHGVFTPIKTLVYERHVAACGQTALFTRPAWRKACPSKEWFYLEIEIHHPKNTYPDASNVLKSIEDGLEGIIWLNDRTVVPRVSAVLFRPAYGVDVVIYPV